VEPETDIVLGLPGGGGFGDPLTRDPELVRADVLDGYVSRERALEAYGVVLEGAPDRVDGALHVDLSATQRLRAQLAEHREAGHVRERGPASPE